MSTTASALSVLPIVTPLCAIVRANVCLCAVCFHRSRLQLCTPTHKPPETITFLSFLCPDKEKCFQKLLFFVNSTHSVRDLLSPADVCVRMSVPFH